MKQIASFLILFLMALQAVSQHADKYFPADQLTSVGAYYYPEHWDESQWDRDLQKMAEMGFEFTHFAEFAWAQLEPEEGVYRFEWLDRAIALAAKHNLKVILCTSTATPPVWLVRSHPDILITREDGIRYDHGSRQHASFSNEFYRSYALKMIEELAKRYGNDARVVGWQLDNEPHSTVDYGEDAQKRFRRWLKEKYNTIDALNKAWGTNFWSGTYSDFSEINLPQHTQWGMNLYQRLDHSRFCDDETATFKELDFITYTRYMVYGEHEGIGKKGYRVGEYSRIAMANDYFRPLTLIYYEQYHYGIVGTDGVTPTRGGMEFQQFIDEINLLRLHTSR